MTFVSDEAFRLDASSAVNTIMLALQLLVHPEDTMSKANLAVIYQNMILNKDLNLSEILTGFDSEVSKADSFLPEAYIENMPKLLKSLYLK